MTSSLYKPFINIAQKEFSDIIENTEIIVTSSWRVNKLRFNIVDNSFVDVWYSLEGRYSFHWEQSGVREYIYRHDNAPHIKWKNIKTFPKHCHDRSEENVVESTLSDNPNDALREFLSIVRKKLREFKFNN